MRVSEVRTDFTAVAGRAERIFTRFFGPRKATRERITEREKDAVETPGRFT